MTVRRGCVKDGNWKEIKQGRVRLSKYPWAAGEPQTKYQHRAELKEGDRDVPEPGDEGFGVHSTWTEKSVEGCEEESDEI